LVFIFFFLLKKNRLDPESRTYFVFKYTQAKSKSRGSTYNYKYNCINNGQWLMNTVSSTYILTLHDTHHTLQIPSWNKTFIHLG
jgi:hypothetical protein